jgi:hypothetical protein
VNGSRGKLVYWLVHVPWFDQSTCSLVPTCHPAGIARKPGQIRRLRRNGNRVRLWKRELQVLANEVGIVITVNHLPPRTSKWNRIEHKLFAFITMNWRAKPLVSYLAIIQLIASTTTETGRTLACQLASNVYEKGIKVLDEEMASLNIKPNPFHGEWNYTIARRQPDE